MRVEWKAAAALALVIGCLFLWLGAGGKFAACVSEILVRETEDETADVQMVTLERDGEPIKLTRAEYEMLVAFVTNPGEILSRERLLRMLSARRVENPDLRTVDVLIRRLRHKLSADLLVTQHGEGYFLAADVC